MTQHDTIDALARYMERHDSPYVNYHGLAEGIVGRFGVVELPRPLPAVKPNPTEIRTWEVPNGCIGVDPTYGTFSATLSTPPRTPAELRALAAAIMAAAAHVDEIGLIR